MHRLVAFFASIVLLVIAPACGSGGTGSGGAGGASPPLLSTGSIIVGVVSDLRVDVDFQALHVVMKAGTTVLRDEVWKAGENLAIPAELPFEDLPHATPIHVELEALLAAGAS